MCVSQFLRSILLAMLIIETGGVAIPRHPLTTSVRGARMSVADSAVAGTPSASALHTPIWNECDDQRRASLGRSRAADDHQVSPLAAATVPIAMAFAVTANHFTILAASVPPF